MQTNPTASSTSKYNIQDLPSDRIFEEFMHRIFQSRINDDLKTEFDVSYLMPGVAEKGVDVLLKLNGANKGAVQCKFNTSGNLNKSDAAKEIIKFALYYHLDNTLISDINSFKYFFAVSGKFSSTTIQLLSNIKGSLLHEPNMQLWTEAVIKKYANLNHLTYAAILPSLTSILSNIDIIMCSASEINKWLHDYPNVASEFFEVKKVIDNANLTKGLKEVVEAISPDLEKKYEQFIDCYKTSALGHLDSVKFIGHHTSVSSTPRNMTVTKLYVEPTLTVKAQNKSKETLVLHQKKEKEIRAQNIFNYNKHYIILGDPGAGKSLMVKNLIINVIKNKSLKGGISKVQNSIPFRIELRKYSESKAKSPIGIIAYLHTLLQSEYQISDLTIETVNYIIKQKSTLFFFDGLDEIFDISHKNAIKDDIINFIRINNLVKAVVTSRFIGYHDIEFPEYLFGEYSIGHFDKVQINSFVDKFYATQISNKSEREKEVIVCKKQLEEVNEELKSNPLILSLMAMLALNNIVIPDSKLEVYRSITNTLVETRDRREKELDFNLKVKSVRGTFGSLSFWQYCQTTDKQPINNIRAKEQITKYLLETGEFSDRLLAEEASRSFLEYAENRSIYFDNNFTHKTFLEYYTADYIYTRLHNGFDIKGRDRIITNYISNSSWHIVFELLLSMIDEHIVDNAVIEKLLSKQLGTSDAETHYFLLSQLDKLTNISNKVKEAIFRESISIILKGIDVVGRRSHPSRRSFRQENLFNLLQHIAQQDKNHSILQELLYEYEASFSEDLDLINFYNFLKELNDYWDYGSKKTPYAYKVKNNDKLDKLKLLDFTLFNHCLLKEGAIIDDLTLETAVFGVDSVFADSDFKFLKGTARIPLFDIYIWQNDYSSVNQLDEELSKLAVAGTTLEKIKQNASRLRFKFIKRPEQINNIVKMSSEACTVLVKEFLAILITNMDTSEIRKHFPNFKS